MRTSYTQYVMMVEFMERHGDLSKPCGGPRGRHNVQMKWKELSNKLNSEGSGDTRSEEKWRKVWSDFKNNTKKKWAKINRAASGTGGGPALQWSMTDLENRVMQIIGVQAASGMVVVEAGFQQSEETQVEVEVPIVQLQEAVTEDWDTPGTSSQQPTVTAPEIEDVEEPWKPPPKKKKNSDNISQLFVESERNAREYARERDIAFERLETERLRVQEYEIRERVRQRDLELQLQAQWLEFMKEAMNVIVSYFDRDS